MNPRVTTSVIGVLTTVMGVLALLYPADGHAARCSASPSTPTYSANFVLGEVRAAYGGDLHRARHLHGARGDGPGRPTAAASS